MTVQTKVTEEELRKVFADTLDKGYSRSGILVAYREGEEVRVEIGVPYFIVCGALEIGPYYKNMLITSPSDYHDRKRLISISDIVRYRKIELSNIFEEGFL